MCSFPEIDDFLLTFNARYYDRYGYINKYGEASNPVQYYDLVMNYKYCENCGTILYWPYHALSLNDKVEAYGKATNDTKYLIFGDHIDNYYGGVDPKARQLVEKKKQLDEYRIQLKKEVEETEICPVCGGNCHMWKKWKMLDGYQFWRDEKIETTFVTRLNNKQLNKADYLEELKKKKGFIEAIDRQKAYYKEHDDETGEKEYENYTQSIEQDVICESAVPAENIIPEKIKKSADLLCKYLFNSLQLEQNIYMLDKRMKILFRNLPGAQREVRYRKYNSQVELTDGIEEEKQKLESRIDEIAGYSYDDFGLEPLPLPVKPTAPFKPDEPRYEKPGLFNKKKVLAQNAVLEELYKDALKRYEERMAAYRLGLEKYEKEYPEVIKRNEELEKELELQKENLIQQAKSESESKIAQIKENNENGDSFPEVFAEQFTADELQLAKDTYKQLLIARERYYLPDVIFAKYRDMAAIATMYEYLKSGRCVSLEGPNGAYNLYETELRANAVISKLDVVIAKLDKIKNNQYVLYSTMKSIDSKLSRIDRKMDEACASLRNISTNTTTIKENTEVISYNTAKTAFYSEMTAAISAAMLFNA